MKKNVIVLLLALLSLDMYAKTLTGDKVDPLIEHRFQRQFGHIANVSWKVIDDISIATFVDQGQEQQVYYFSDGEIFGFGKTISKDALPVTVANSVSARFNSAIIQTAYQFQTQDAPTRYYMRVVNSRYSMILSTDEFGTVYVERKEKLK